VPQTATVWWSVTISQSHDSLAVIASSEAGSSEAIVELLVESGADINAPTNNGQTALDLVVQYKGDYDALLNLLKRLGGKMGSEL